MKITLVPATVVGGGTEHFQFATSAVINDRLAVDAGCLGFHQSPQEQTRIRHLLLTHTHADHVATLPIFVENVYEAKKDCITLYGSTPVLESVQKDIFNDRIWPDFVTLSKNSERPFVRLQAFEPGETIMLEGLKITSVPVNHVVPTVGYVLEDEQGSVVFIADTGPTEQIWQVANGLTNLRGVFIETTFPNDMKWLAEVSLHLTPLMLAEELKKLHHQVRVLVVHVKARYQAKVIQELKALGNPRVEVAQFGVPYTF